MRRVKEHISLMREFSAPLIAGVAISLFWANLGPGSYHAFLHDTIFGSITFLFLTNDIFMVFFFGIAAVEITQSCLPGGDLNPLKKAVNPLLATVGGVLGPAATYLILNHLVGSDSLARGWGIPTATDIAFAWIVARMVFGGSHPAVSFLLLLAVADDAVGLAIIALFYPDPAYPLEPAWLLLTALGMVLALLLRMRRVRTYWPYVIAGGALSWTGLFRAHLHPALALVFIIPFLPHGAREKMHFFEDDPADRSPLSQYEHDWKIIVDFGLFMFGLANAGVSFSTLGPVTWIVLLSLLVGKSIGVYSMGAAAVRMGFPLPAGMRKQDLLVAGVIAGFGFTVALFVSGEAFTDPLIQGAAKMGALLSFCSALIALPLGRVLKIRKAP